MRDVDALADAVARRLAALTSGVPLLWSVKDAMTRTGMPRGRLFEAFHAGQIEGLWSGGARGRGTVLLKPESVLAWIDQQVRDQAHDAQIVRGETARTV